MEIRNLVRTGIIGAAAITVASSTARSQIVTFNQGTCSPEQCNFGGYTLLLSGIESSAGGLHGGDFSITCFTTCEYGDVVTGSTFFLTVDQRNPHPGDRDWHGDEGDGPGCGKACDHDDPPPNNFTPTFNDVLPNSVTTTPEPATIGLMATGLVGLIPVVRRRRKN
jgi:hypothetical protein